MKYNKVHTPFDVAIKTKQANLIESLLQYDAKNRALELVESEACNEVSVCCGLNLLVNNYVFIGNSFTVQNSRFTYIHEYIHKTTPILSMLGLGVQLQKHLLLPVVNIYCLYHNNEQEADRAMFSVV